MIYFVMVGDGGPVKIGATTNLARRLKEHAKASGDTKLTLLGIMDGGPKEERALHKRFAHLKTGTTPICERFHPAEELMDFIRESSRPWNESDDSASRAARNGLVLRCSPAFRDWLKSAAEADRTSQTDFLTRAAKLYAKKVGFAKPAPPRT